MTAVGVDTHKATLAACAVDALGVVLGERTFANDPAGHQELADWAAALGPTVRFGVEGSSTYGAAFARFLVARGVAVREVPPQLSHRERGRLRRAGKSDAGDALAIARVTAREPDLPPVRVLDRTRQIGLLLEARQDLVEEATRVRNRVHALLTIALPGYGGQVTGLTSAKQRATARALLRGKPGLEVELARTLLDDLARLGNRAEQLTARLALLVGDHPVLRLRGVAVLTAARLIAETGDIRRFRSEAALASLAGVAPIPASSGQTQRMRLNRGGNRQLNRAFYTIALTQSFHHPAAREYLTRKRVEGKTRAEALRCLKRRLVRPFFHLRVEGQPGLAMA